MDAGSLHDQALIRRIACILEELFDGFFKRIPSLCPATVKQICFRGVRSVVIVPPMSSLLKLRVLKRQREIVEEQQRAESLPRRKPWHEKVASAMSVVVRNCRLSPHTVDATGDDVVRKDEEVTEDAQPHRHE